jgi:hypothetical protein
MRGVTSYEFWRKWLFASVVATGAFGIALALFDTRPIPWVGEAIARQLWQTPTPPANVVTYHRFVHGVLGATLAGWAVTLAFIVRGPLRERAPWAWRAIAFAFGAWFTIDTTASLVFGVWPNVVLNFFSVAPIGLGLAMLRGGLARST